MYDDRSAAAEADEAGPGDPGSRDTANATLREAYAKAADRCLEATLRRESLDFGMIRNLTLQELPECPEKAELLQCRQALGLSMLANSRVFIDADHERK